MPRLSLGMKGAAWFIMALGSRFRRPMKALMQIRMGKKDRIRKYASSAAERETRLEK